MWVWEACIWFIVCVFIGTYQDDFPSFSSSSSPSLTHTSCMYKYINVEHLHCTNFLWFVSLNDRRRDFISFSLSFIHTLRIGIRSLVFPHAHCSRSNRLTCVKSAYNIPERWLNEIECCSLKLRIYRRPTFVRTANGGKLKNSHYCLVHIIFFFFFHSIVDSNLSRKQVQVPHGIARIRHPIICLVYACILFNPHSSMYCK